MENITDFYAYENYASFDVPRPLKWCNGAILHACQYYEQAYLEKITYDGILADMRAGKLRAIVSLLYGAARMADSKIDYYRFSRIYKAANIEEYVNTVLAGIKQYQPEPEIKDSGMNLADDYPDTQAEVKKKTVQTKSLIGPTGTGSPDPSSTSRRKNSLKQRSGQSISNTSAGGQTME